MVTTPPDRRVTLEVEPGRWTVTVNGSIRYHGRSEPHARQAYHWAAWGSHREPRGVVRAEATRPSVTDDGEA